MTAATVLAELRAAGIVPVLRGEGIGVPIGRLTDAQREAIRRSKPELLALLRAELAKDGSIPNVRGHAQVADVPTPISASVSSRALARCREDVNEHCSKGAEYAENPPELQGEAAERHRARLDRFGVAGLPYERAMAAADRLALRDADYRDDRRMCGECSYLGAGGYCLAARVGRLRGVSPDLQPVVDMLQRCEGFGLRKGLE